MDGSDGSNGWSSGADGSSGGSAGRAERGGDAGSVVVALRSHASDAGLSWGEAHIAGKPGKEGQLQLGALGDVVVSAIGGRGGDGGVGGAGGDGARGYSGSDATRSSSGSDGGPGGDGGSGGRGSSGGDGGAGGKITLRVDGRDSYLLMAVPGAEAPAPLVRGGVGGRPGRHGRGGGGGPGGSGGSSYSWSETERYTDSNGNAQTRTTSHYNSGGSSGRRGSDGWTPTDPLYEGAVGRSGQFLIEVAGEGAGSYGARYDLAIVDFRLVEDSAEDVDGIFEFGEVVHVSGLRLRNIGQIATPTQQRLRLTIRRGQWVVASSDELFVGASIPPGYDLELPGTLRFHVAQVVIDAAGEPFVAREPVSVVVQQLGPERAATGGKPVAGYQPGPDVMGRFLFARVYERANLTRELVAQFPVENRAGIVCLRSLGPGERSKLGFDIHNISNRPIGRSTERARRVGLQIQMLASDVSVEHVQFWGADGEEMALGAQMEGFDGYFVEVDAIEAGGVFRFQGRIGFRDEVKPYVGAQIRATIWIEDRHTDAPWRVVQRRDLVLRSEPAYAYRPESKVLLVTNNNTSQEAFLAWKRLLEDELGLPFDHWSMSRYGHFDQRMELEDGTNLRVQLEDRMTLVLNQPFHARSDDKTDLPTDYMLGRDFREGATNNGAHFTVIGSDKFQMQEWLQPTSEDRTGGDDFESVSAFLKREQQSLTTYEEETFKEDITRYVDQVPMHRTAAWFWTPKVDEAKLHKEAQGVMARLEALHPNRRYVLVHEPLEKPVRDGTSWLILPRWRMGTLSVRRTLNVETSSAVLLTATPEQLNDPGFIFSEDARLAILLALPFESKLDLLNALLQQDKALEGTRARTAEKLVKAILVDLSEEQTALTRGKGLLEDERKIRDKLTNLHRLLDYPLFTNIPASSPSWGLLFEISATLRALVWARAPWWRHFDRQRRIADYVGARLDELDRKTYDAQAIDVEGEVAMSRAVAEPQIEERARALWAQMKEERAKLGFFALMLTVAVVIIEQLKTQQPVLRDIDTWSSREERVWSAERFDQVQAEEAERQQRQADFYARNAAVRAEMMSEDAPVASQGHPDEAVVFGLEDAGEPVVVEEAVVEASVAEREA
jgi:hypothetical protein